MQVRMYIPGGIGNQLFSFVAGLYFMKKYAEQLELNLTYVDKKHGSDTFLDLIGASVNTMHMNGISVKENEFRFGRLGDFIKAKIRGSDLDWFFRPNSYSLYEEDFSYPFQKKAIDILFRDNINENKRIRLIKVNGYFQDFAYLNEVMSMFYAAHPFDLFRLFGFSTLEKESTNQRTEPTCAIHIRLGDFRESSSQSFGILSPAYYHEKMRMLRDLNSELKFVVFSDEIQLAREIYGELDAPDVIWFGLTERQSRTKTIDVFWKMSSASHFILGNSTFGFWAAILARNSETIYHPWPMYKSSNSQGILSIPKTWQSFTSDFM